MLSDGTWNYSYDADGNLVGKTQTTMSGTLGWAYTYDQKNELLSALEYLNTGTYGNITQEEETYKYDAYGNRIETDVTGVGTTVATVYRYAYDGWNPAQGQGVGNENWNVWADLNGSNGLISRYVWGDKVDQLFAREDLSSGTYTTYWMLTDNLGFGARRGQQLGDGGGDGHVFEFRDADGQRQRDGRGAVSVGW